MVYEDAIFIYPPKIEMTPYDCDMWVASTIAKLTSIPKYFDYVFDRVLYWRLENSHNVTIKRDREWFDKNLPIFEKSWKYVEFFREHKDKSKLLKLENLAVISD